MHAFVENIRASDTATKMRWVFILSGVCFVLVVALWMISLHMITSDIKSGAIAGAKALETPGEVVSAGEKIKQGFGELKLRTRNSYENIKQLFHGTETAPAAEVIAPPEEIETN